MKRRIVQLLLAAVLLVGLLTPAVAAVDAADPEGIYDLEIVSEYLATATIVPLTADSESPVSANANGVYPAAVRLQVTVTGITDNYSLIFAQNEDGVPTESNLVYIDQKSAEAGTLSFLVYPSALKGDTTYYLYLSGTSGRDLLASFKYNVPYVLGDINGDGDIDSIDALLVLQHSVKIVTLEGKQFLAADVNGDGDRDSVDALLILQYSVGIIASFD